MPRHTTNRVFWLLVSVSALMFLLGVPWLHGSSKAALNRANVQQIQVLDDLSEDGAMELSASVSLGEVKLQLSGPLRDEIYGQFLHSAAVLTIAAGAILVIAFYMRYQISAVDETPGD